MPLRRPDPNGRQPITGRISPKRRESYSFQDEGRPSSGVPEGDKTLKAGVSVSLFRPVWTKGRLVFRPLPMVTVEKDGFEPYKLGPDAYDFSDFMRKYPGAFFVGTAQQYSFIPYRASQNYDRRTNPYVILRSAISSAVSAGHRNAGPWTPLVSGKNQKLPKPVDVLFMQGFIFEHGDNHYLLKTKQPYGAADTHKTPIIQIKGSAVRKLLSMLTEPVRGYRGDPDNYEASLAYGDIVGLDAGRFISVYNPSQVSGVMAPVSDDEAVDMEWDVGGRGDSDTDEKAFGKGYEVSIDKTYTTVKGQRVSAKLAGKEEALMSKVLEWDDLIYIPTHEELCVLLAKAFSNMPSVLKFGWADNREFFSDEVKGILASRTQVAVSDDLESRTATRQSSILADDLELEENEEALLNSTIPEDEYEQDDNSDFAELDEEDSDTTRQSSAIDVEDENEFVQEAVDEDDDFVEEELDEDYVDERVKSAMAKKQAQTSAKPAPQKTTVANVKQAAAKTTGVRRKKV